MAEPSLVVTLAAEFVGKPAFKQADTATQKLSKNVKQLAKTLGVAFGTTAILAYGRASLRAAARDEKAQKQLALALKNVGLGRDAASSEEYIQRLQTEFNILDDNLRPAYQTLAVATKSTEQAQKLFNLALDISASKGLELGSVTGALSKAFLGNNTALSKLGIGISKADLKAGKFDDIVTKLTTTFAGSATAATNTFQGSIDKLAVASANAQETIGVGLITSLQLLGGQNGIGTVTTAIDELSIGLADALISTSKLVNELKKLPVIGDFLGKLVSNPLSLPKDFLTFGKGGLLDAFRDYGKVAGLQKASDNAHLKALQKSVVFKKVLTAEELTALAAAQKTLAAKKLAEAIDKANLALSKGGDVFEMDKIQIAAALANQAEQLGKTTNAAQLIQIANDTARLNVKKSIADLEDAIASKDTAAITAATSKLNANLGVLNALTGQKTQLVAIESVLSKLMPKDLINQQNLDIALDKIKELIRLLAIQSTSGAGSSAGKGSSASKGSSSSFATFVAPLSYGASSDVLSQYAATANARANHFADLLDKQTGYNSMSNIPETFVGSSAGLGLNGTGRQVPQGVTITIVDKTSGLIEVVQNAVIQNKRFGNNLSFAGSID